MAALKGQVDILVQVAKYLGGDIQVATTHCALRECYQLGPTLSGNYHTRGVGVGGVGRGCREGAGWQLSIVP